MRFAYQSEKFYRARSMLMLPHPRGEAESIANAFHECSLGLQNINVDDLPAGVKNWVILLSNLMDTSGLSDPDKRGLWAVKAESFSFDQKIELSRVVNELSDWFDMKFYDKD
ncbi:MAG: hypothetical protein PHE55_20655 [Methylococcaceae bacterium]|nr:hypothetical protein [Methylococcaceae bacterium]